MPARLGIRKTTFIFVCFVLPAALAACSDSSTDPEEETVPVVVALAADDDAEFDADVYKRSCQVGPGGSLSTTCPVVQWDGYEYWALSYLDNRGSFAIHAYDQGGTLLDVVERTGARYVYAIDVDTDAGTVIFRGQADNTVTMTWDELRDLR